jgi:hypothetical protein
MNKYTYHSFFSDSKVVVFVYAINEFEARNALIDKLANAYRDGIILPASSEFGLWSIEDSYEDSYE